MEFKELGINASILKVLKEQAYTTPTPIQEKTIPAALRGEDILGLAQTGTGKTAAFAVPTLQRLSKNKQSITKRKIKSLILTPTRELAIQVHESFSIYGRYLPLKAAVVFGGVGQGSQVQALRSGIDILIATPGRLMDLINQGHIDISAVEIFILDEADRMLDMGFIHEVRRIIKLLPLKKQTLLFSATMPKEMEAIVEKLLVNPTQVSVAPVSSTVDIIEQSVYYVDRNHKTDILVDFFKDNQKDSVLIFTRTKHGADRVAKQLGRKGIKAQAIHGDKSQGARQTALKKFKSRELRALIATDIASRGIDINELKYVINYDLPEVPETYVHRIGRTGRAGHEGKAISLCSFQEIKLLKDIEKLIKKDIKVLENEQYPMIDKSEKAKPQPRKAAAKRQPAQADANSQSARPKEQNKGTKIFKNRRSSYQNPKL